MTMPSLGSAISFAQLQTEFGGAATNISLGNYYAGGSNVPSGTPGYPNGGGPTGAGFVAIPTTSEISLKSFSAAAKLTVQTFDTQIGTRTTYTDTIGSWTVPRIIQGDVTITVIGGGTPGYGGPSAAKGGGGGGGAQRVISGTDLFRYVNPGDTIAYQAGKGGNSAAANNSTFGISGQEWYILGGAAGLGSSSPTGGSAGTGGTSSGTVPTYGTRTLGSGGNGGGTAQPGITQGAGGGGQKGAGHPGGTGAGWGGNGGPGNPGTGNIQGNPLYMGFFPGGGGGATDSSGQVYGAQGAGGGVRIQYTGSST